MTKKEFNDLLALCQGETEDTLFIQAAVKEVAYSGNPHFIYDLIEYCPAVDTLENMRILEDAIIALASLNNNIIIAYEFMFEMATDFEIKNFNLRRFEELIILSGNPKLIHYCIRCIKGSNVPKMLEALYATRSEKYITYVKQKYDHSVNKELYPGETIFNDEYDAALEKAKTDLYFPNWIYAFETSDFQLLCQRVISSKVPYFINELADYFEYLIAYVLKDDVEVISMLGGLIEHLNVAIKEYGTTLDKYEYAWSIDSVDKGAVEEDVISSGEVKFMYYFIDIPGANKEELYKAIKDSGNQKYIDLIKPNINPDGSNPTKVILPS